MEGKDRINELQEQIGYRFSDASLLRRAVTHSSLSAEGHVSYERLEFLGDAVVALVVAQELFDSPAGLTEGQMTEIRSRAVSKPSMARAGRRLKLHRHLRVDRGLAQRRKYPPSLVADAYEAVVGAVFLDAGLERAREFVLRTLEAELTAAERGEPPLNFKAILQQLVQAEGQEPPSYQTVKKAGPEHDSSFLVAVFLAGKKSGAGWGKTKKEAEQKAAQSALQTHYPPQDAGEGPL